MLRAFLSLKNALNSCVALFIVVGATSGVVSRAWAGAPQVEVRTSDVDLFYRIYDAAHGAPTGLDLQRDYIDGGSDGVRQFVPYRIKSGADLAEKIAKNRDLYDHARDCMSVLPAVKARLASAFQKLADIDPDATFPPVTILIGRNNSGGTTAWPVTVHSIDFR